LKNNSSEISSYPFKSGDELLVDTNVWFSIYGPVSPDWRTAVYSKALKEMLTASCDVYVDVLILSEYVNRYARLRHNILKSAIGIEPDFKKFRKSFHFKPIAADIAGDVRQIMKHCERIENDFATLDIDALMDEFEKGDSDLNDQILVELCKHRNLKLVTHDSDFKDRGLDVLTANKALLS
jgi:predicted nucleic acid-binding protein